MKVTGIILAGGKSKRMGRDKRTLEIKGSRFIDRVYSVFSEFCSQIIVSYSTPESKLDLNAEAVFDEVANYGPVAGICSALKRARHEIVALAPVDTPALTSEVYMKMLRKIEGYNAVVPKNGRFIEPLIAVYRKEPLLESCTLSMKYGEKSVHKVVHRMKNVNFVDIREISPDLLSFENVNTPEDYLRLKKLLGV